MISDKLNSELSKQVSFSAVSDTNWHPFLKDTVSASGVYYTTENDTKVSQFPLPVAQWKDPDNNSAEILGLAIALETLLQNLSKTTLLKCVFCFVDSEATERAFKGRSKTKKKWPNEVERLLRAKSAFEVRGVQITCRWVGRDDPKVAEQDSRAR